MKIKICPLCATVSSIWLVLSAGVAWGYLAPATFIVPISLLMGGTVVGIAYLGEKHYRWAVLHPQRWKTLVISVGMPVAYLFVAHITKFVVIAELSVIIVVAYFFFIESRPQNVGTRGSKISEIKEQMEQCC